MRLCSPTSVINIRLVRLGNLVVAANAIDFAVFPKFSACLVKAK